MPELKSDRPTYTVDFVPGDTLGAVFLGNPILDNLMHTVMALGAELWAAKRRIKVIESLLAAKKDVSPAAIEAYVPTDEQLAEWTAERDLMIKLTYGNFANVAVPASTTTAK